MRSWMGMALLWMVLHGNGQSLSGNGRYADYANQMLALAVLTGQVEDGTTIGEKGLGGIGGTMEKENAQHQAFYSGYGRVSSAVLSTPERTEILKRAETALRILEAAIGRWISGGLTGSGGTGDVLSSTNIPSFLTVGDWGLIDTVVSGIEARVRQDLTVLNGLVTPEMLSFSDGQRLERIRILDGDMGNVLGAAIGFVAVLDGLIASRAAEWKNGMSFK